MALKSKAKTQTLTSKINYFIDNPAGGCFSIEHIESVSVSVRGEAVVCAGSNNKYIGYIEIPEAEADDLAFIAQTISNFVKRGEGVPVDFSWGAAFEERDLAILEAEEKALKVSTKKSSQPSTN